MTAGMQSALRVGLLGGLAAWHVSLVGMVQTFAGRQLISGTIVNSGPVSWRLSLSLGYALLLGLMLVCGNMSGRGVKQARLSLLRGAITGATIGLATAVLALLIDVINLRAVFQTATPELVNILTFKQGLGIGLILPIAAGTVIGVLGAALDLVPPQWRRILVTAVIVTLMIGLMRDVIYPVINRTFLRTFFTRTGVTWPGATLLFVVTALLTWAVRTYGLPGARVARDNAARMNAKNLGPWRYVYLALAAALLLSFPNWATPFLSNIAVMVGFFIIMGLGLNLVVGFAGLLDLGYVAFFAIGAYTMAVFTSPEMGYGYSFWAVLPFSMLFAMIAGVLLGLPVLRMRGDYLAIATLGFGEIIRILVLSDALSDILGGSQGIILIGRPQLPFADGAKPFFEINSAPRFFYMVVIGCMIAWFVATRLRDSRLGRAWMAIREDEDVAQAMGINRVTAKLLAFSIGAFLGGMAGAMFASLLGSVVPRSFELLISINVLAVIIVGGMGSLPGVLVGALALVGLPELLREFQEYRMLVYGIVLVLMMLYRPEGLWPEKRRAAELHETEEEPVSSEIPASVPADRPPRESGTAPVKLEER